MDVNLRVVSSQQKGANLRAVSLQQMGVNPRAGIKRFHRRIPVGTEKRIRDPHVTREVLAITEGSHRVGESHSAHDWYAKEARNPPQTFVHKAEKHHAINTQRGSKDIIFTEADAKRVHYPHIDALVITVRVANSNVNGMLVDNGSPVDILYWDAYKKRV